MQRLLCWVSHPVCKLCEDAMDILEGRAEQYGFVPLFEQRPLQDRDRYVSACFKCMSFYK